MHLEAAIERVWRCNWRLWLSDDGDALTGRDRASLEMQLEALIEQDWLCTWRLWLCELGCANRASLDIHLEVIIELVWRCTWRPWSSEIAGVLGGGQSGGGSLGGRQDRSRDSVHWVTHNCANIENCVQHRLPRDERLAGSGRESILEWCSMWCMQYSVHAVLGVRCNRYMLYSVYAILGVCYTRCMLYSVYAILGVCYTRCMLYSVYAILGVCYTRCMLYSVYALLGVTSQSWHWEIERDDLTSCSQVMVEWRTRKREMRGYGGNHHEKLGLERISCASQFTIPDRAGMSPDPAGNDTDTRSSQLYRASCTPGFSFPLVVSTPFSSSSPISLFFVHNCTIISEHKPQSSLCISSSHDHELAPSIAYTEYNIHREQHLPEIVCLHFIVMIISWPLNEALASGVPLHESSKVMSPCNIPMVAS